MSAVATLLDRIEERLPGQRALVEPLRHPGREQDDLGRYVAHALASGASLDHLTAAYARIVEDTLREQMYFRRHGRYRHASFAEVAAHVYFDDAYMSLYMHGLALSAFLWPNHVAIRRYVTRVIEEVSTPGDKRYLEVGPGHGFFIATAARVGFGHVEGIDLSPTSIAMTRAILASGLYGAAATCQLVEGDFLAHRFERPFDVLVMGEVLEHVEEPARFLSRLRDAAAPGAVMCVTTCVNSPAIDHIYCFRSAGEVVDLCASAGLTLRDQLVLPYHGTTLAESERERLPINIALVLAP